MSFRQLDIQFRRMIVMQYSDRAAAVLDESRKHGNQLGIVDVLAAVMTRDRGVGQHALNQIGVERETILKLQQSNNPSTVLLAIQRTAESESLAMQHSFVGTEHLALACVKMLEMQPEWPHIHQALKVDYAAVKAAVVALLGKSTL